MKNLYIALERKKEQKFGRREKSLRSDPITELQLTRREKGRTKMIIKPYEKNNFIDIEVRRVCPRSVVFLCSSSFGRVFMDRPRLRSKFQVSFVFFQSVVNRHMLGLVLVDTVKNYISYIFTFAVP